MVFEAIALRGKSTVTAPEAEDASTKVPSVADFLVRPSEVLEV